VEPSLTPLTATSRGVGLWLGLTVIVVAVLTGAGLMRPAFPNEAEVVAGTFLVGAFVGAAAVWRKEPATAALSWALANALLAVLVLAFARQVGLAA